MNKYNLSKLLDQIGYIVAQITFPLNHTEKYDSLNFAEWIFCYCNYKLLENPNVIWDAEIWNNEYFCDRFCLMKYHMSKK